MKNTGWNMLIPELKEWNNGNGIDPESWIGATGNYQLAVAYTTIFWPSFMEYDDMILPDGMEPNAVADFLKAYDGDKTAVEAVANHVHLDAIHCSGEDATAERLVFLSNVLKEIYSCKLRTQFPNREIIVEFDDSPKERLTDYQLVIYQRREK